MPQVYLSLGSNLEDRAANMKGMEAELSGVLAAPLRASRLMETEPLDMPAGSSPFLNRIVAGGFDSNPEDLLSRCQRVEQNLGRPADHGPAQSRAADIDILLFGGDVVVKNNLVIPHPRIAKRRFCLEGLNELAPLMVFPGTGTTIQRMYSEMDPAVRRQRVRFRDA